MAEFTAMRNDVLPYPVYGLPYVVTFPILDNDGDLVTAAAALDSEISLNGDTAAACTNEATEIATSTGTYYLSLTAAELTTNVATVRVKTTTTDAKTTTLVLYPRVLPVLRDNQATAGAASTITLDASAPALADYYNGAVIYLDGGTGSGQARTITDYTTGRVATVSPAWATIPDATSTFLIYQTDMCLNAVVANVESWDLTATAASTDTAIADKTSELLTQSEITGYAGALGDASGRVTLAPTQTVAITGNITGNLSGSVGSVTGAVGSVTGAVGSVTGNVGGNVTGSVGSVATGGITAASIATDAIDADALAADAVAELADGVWDEATSGHVTSGTFGQRFQIIRTATAQAGGAASITLDASAHASNDWYNNCIVHLIGGTGAGQARKISAYNGTTKVATVSINWVTQPGVDSVFVIYPVVVESGSGATAQQVWEYTTRQLTAAQTFDLTGDITGNLSGSVGSVTGAVGSVTGAVGSVTGNVGGNVVGSVASVTGAVGSVTGSVGSVVGHTAQTGDSYARLGAPAGLSVSADVAAVKGDTAAILVDTADMQPKLGAPAANLAADIAAVKVDTAATLADTGTDGVVVAAASKTGYALSAAGIDGVLDEVVEGTTTFRQMLRGFASTLFGKLLGAGTTTVTIRDLANTKDRVTATVDASGNRTPTVLDLT